MPLNPNIRKIDSNVFTGLVDQGNPYLGEAISQGFGAISGAIKDVEAANEEKRLREEQERAMALQEYKEAGQTFQVVPDQDDTLDVVAAKENAAAGIVDEAASLARAYKKGEITIDEYKAAEKNLNKALQQINNGGTYLETVGQNFDNMSGTPDSISKSTSPQALAVAKAVKTGKVTLQYNPETGQMSMVELTKMQMVMR